MQSTLFDLGPTAQRQEQSCTHPTERQIITGNLFTGDGDLVCEVCNATLAESYQKSFAVYSRGDGARYTGASQMLHGAVCYEIEVMEGTRTGSREWTYRAPATHTR